MKIKKIIGLLAIVGLLNTIAITTSAEATSKLPWLKNIKDRSLKRVWWVNWRWSEAECRFRPETCKGKSDDHPPVLSSSSPSDPNKV